MTTLFFSPQGHDQPRIRIARQAHDDGLCGNCEAADGCGWRSEDGRPRQACAEHRVPAGPVGTVALKSAPGQAADVANPPVEIPAERRLGLCATCANATTCRFPAQPGGVWHCEEFC